MKSVRLEFRVSPEERAWLAALAGAARTDASTVVRTLIRDAHVRTYGAAVRSVPPVATAPCRLELPTAPVALHAMLTGAPPSPRCAAVYERSARGVATLTPTIGDVEATIVAALAQALGSSDPVFVFESEGARELSASRTRALAERAFERLRDRHDADAAPVARRLGEAFERLRLGTPAPWPPAPPPAWVALGFGGATEDLPEWVRAELLEVVS